MNWRISSGSRLTTLQNEVSIEDGTDQSLKKIRELKKDIARVQTVLRQKELAGGNGAAASASSPEEPSSDGEEGGQQEGCDGEKVTMAETPATSTEKPPAGARP